MAKKESFDFDDFDDFDDFNDFEDGDGSGGFKSTTRKGKAREAVVALSGGLISGVKKNLFTRNFYQTLTSNALPKEYSAALDKSLEASDAIADIYDTAKRESVDINDKLTRGVKPLVDKYGDKIPKRMQRPLREWTRNVKSSSKWTTENKDELETVAALNDIFNKREQTRSAKNTSIQSQVQTGIAQTNMSLTAQMLSNQQRMLSYQDQIDVKWKRKSLELQYKQLFVQRKLLDVSEQSLALSRVAFGDIVKNTALPDWAKAQKSEVASRLMTEKLYGAAIDRFSSLPYNLLQSTANSITKKMRDGGADLRELLADTFDNLDDNIEEGADIAGTIGPLGAARMGGEMASDNVSGYLAKLIGKRVSKKYGDNAKVKHGADILSSGMKRLPRIFADMVKSEDTGSPLLDMILELTDMKSQVDSNNGFVSKNTAGSLDTQVWFDFLTKKSITEIIPGYLSRIHHEIRTLRTGDESHPLIDYDFDKNVFSNDKAIAKKLKERVVGSRNKQILQRSHSELSEKLGLDDETLTPEIRDIFLKEFTKASMNNNDFTFKTLLHEDNDALTDDQKDIFRAFIETRHKVNTDDDFTGFGFKNRIKGQIGNIRSQTAEASAAQRAITDALESLHMYLPNPSGALNMAARRGQLGHSIKTGITDESEGNYTINQDRYIDELMKGHTGRPDSSGNFEEEERNRDTATRRYFDQKNEELKLKLAELKEKLKNSNIRGRAGRVSERFRRRGESDEDDTGPEVREPEVRDFKRVFTETRLTNMHSKYGSNDKVINAIEYAKEHSAKDEVNSADLERAYSESKTFRDLVNDAVSNTKTQGASIKIKATAKGDVLKEITKERRNAIKAKAKIKHTAAKAKISAAVKKKTDAYSDGIAQAAAEADQYIVENNIEDTDGSIKDTLVNHFLKVKFKDTKLSQGLGTARTKVSEKVGDLKDTAKEIVDNAKTKKLDPKLTGAVGLLFELGKYSLKAGELLTRPHRDALKLIPWGIKKLMGQVLETKDFSGVKHGLWLPGEAEPRLLATGLMSGRYVNAKGDVIEKPTDLVGDIFDATKTPAALVLSRSEYKKGLYDSTGKLIYKPPSLKARAAGALMGLTKKIVGGAARLAGKAFMGYLNITTKPARWLINKILSEDRIDPKLHAELAQLGLTEQTNIKLDELNENLKQDKEDKFNDRDGDGERDGNASDVMKSRKEKREEARKAKAEKTDKKSLFDRMFGKKKDKANDDDDEGFSLTSLMGKAKGLGRLSGLLRNPYVMGALALTGLVSYEALTDKAKTQNPDDIANLVLPESVQDSLAARIGVRVADFAVDKVVLGNIRNTAKAGVKVGEWGLRAAKWVGRKTDKLHDGFKNQLNKVGGATVGLLFGRGARRFVDRLLNADNATPLFRFRMAQYGFKWNDKQSVEAILKFEDDILQSLIPATDKAPAKIADSITIEQSAAYFDVSINDEDDLTEWMAWYTNRFRPVFLSNVTVMQRLGFDSRKLHEVDSILGKKDKLTFINKINFWRSEETPYDTNTSPLPTEWRLSYGSQGDVQDVYRTQVAEIEQMSDDPEVVKADQSRTKKREDKVKSSALLKHESTKPSTRFDPYAMIDKLNTKTIAKAFKGDTSINKVKDPSVKPGFGGGGAGQNFANSNATPGESLNPGEPGYNYTVAENGIFGKVLGTIGSALSGMFVQQAHASAFIPEMQYGGASTPMGAKAASQAALMATTSSIKKPDTQLGSKASNLLDKPLKAAAYARDKAKSKSTGYAAKHIYAALIHAGYKFDQPSRASDYAVSVLPEIGFSKLTRGEKPKAGDITVFTGTMDDKNGHVQIYDGVDWISDYVQPTWSPYTRSIPSYSQWRSDEFAEKGSLSTRKSKAQAKVDNAVANKETSNTASTPSTKSKSTDVTKDKSVWQSVKDSASNFISSLKDKVKNSAVGGFVGGVRDKASNALAQMSGSQKEWQLCVYKAFKTAGFSEMQARILTAEIGRENSYNPKYLFAGHADPHKGSNLGMLSWQGDRKPKLVAFLKKAGVLDGANNMVPGQEALDAQARFIMWEMRNTHKGVGAQFLSKPNISYEDGAYLIGKKYILWRIDDPKYAAGGKKNRDGFYNMLVKQLGSGGAGAATNLNDKSSPATKTTLQKTVGAANNVSAAIVGGVKSLNPFSSDKNVDPKASTDDGSAASGGKGVPSNSAPARAAAAARKGAVGKSIGKCARYVRVALQSVGYKFTGVPSAYMYANGTLSSAGFGQISTSTPYQVGDVIVVGRSKAHVHGHICIWDGRNWISDFIQNKWNPYSTPQSYTLWRDRNFLNGASASSGPSSGTGAGEASSGGTFGETGASSTPYNPISMKYNDYTGIDKKMNDSWKTGASNKATPTMADDIKDVPVSKTSKPTKQTTPTNSPAPKKRSEEIAQKVAATASNNAPWKPDLSLASGFAPGSSQAPSSIEDTDVKVAKVNERVQQSLTQKMSEVESRKVNETMFESNNVLQESLRVQRKMLERLESVDRHLSEINRGQKTRQIVESSNPTQQPESSTTQSAAKPKHSVSRPGRQEPMSMSKMI